MFVGRERELELLASLWDKSTASLVSCRGRRRIGKSSLIEEFAKRTADRLIVLEGLAPRKGLSDKRQRAHFCETVSSLLGRCVRAASWTMAFQALDEAIPEDGRTVLLLDEISWMGAYNPDFAGYLKVAWDRLFSKHDRLIVVLCGSVSFWIAENILNSTGFVGRNSLDLEVGELPFDKCFELWGATGQRLSSRERIDFLSITGGVPKYLLELRPAETLEENVRRMCLQPNGLLFREFEETFSSVFGRRAASRRKVLSHLAERPLSVAELAAVEKCTASGRLTQTLRDLCHAGFVSKDCGLNPETGEPLRQERYRICDNYTRFYLKCVEPNRAIIERGLFHLDPIALLPNWEGILGLQFENLVVGHVAELLPHLGLDHTLVESAAPYIRRGKKGEGFQVDLLIQTRRTAIVVEVKRCRKIPYAIVDEVREKIRRLKVRPELSVRTALIYDGELDMRIEAEHAFDFVIPSSLLLSVSSSA